MQHGIWLICTLLGLFMSLKAQQQTPDFGPPLDIDLHLSGTFGELRSNHFHSGIDIKTQGREGLDVLAIEDGVVSRIKVSPYGFGKAVYLRHPNGYTSVYAHLSTFSDEINTYVKKMQHQLQSFAVDLFPEPGLFRVKKGSMIAKSGNSGGSGGPHLHFEIRETASEKPLNPLNFDFEVTDNIEPVIQGITLYDIARDYQLIHTQSAKRYNKGFYKLVDGSLITVNTQEIGVGVNTYDQLNFNHNRNGVAEVEMQVNDRPWYRFEMDAFSFSETRYINAHIDFSTYYQNRSRYQRCYNLPGNWLSIYSLAKNQGVIQLDPGTITNVALIVKDAAGNSSVLRFGLRYREAGENQKVGENSVRWNHDERIIKKAPEFQIDLPALTLYHDLPEKARVMTGEKAPYAPVVQTLDPDVPAHYRYRLSIAAPELPSTLTTKALIVHRDKNGEWEDENGWYEDGWVTTKTRVFGAFTIAVDTLPPKISNRTLSGSMSGKDRFVMTIDDDLSGIDYYRGTIDGQWVVMEYDPKTRRLIHFFDKGLSNGSHDFKLVVRDDKGNESVFTQKFEFQR